MKRKSLDGAQGVTVKETAAYTKAGSYGISRDFLVLLKGEDGI